MRYLLLITFTIFSFSACSKEQALDKTKTSDQVKTVVSENKDVSKDENKGEKEVKAPCDSKEDLLKKINEKEKVESEKGKGFSLQGGNTGCSVK